MALFKKIITIYVLMYYFIVASYVFNVDYVFMYKIKLVLFN